MEFESRRLLTHQKQAFHRARLSANTVEHSSDSLHALSITACGLRLDDEAVRVPVSLRLGCDLCQSHRCPCGVDVDLRGTHGLSCRRNAGRTGRHHRTNDLSHRASPRAEISAKNEPTAGSRVDACERQTSRLPHVDSMVRRPLLTWDVTGTICDAVAESYLTDSSVTAGMIAKLPNMLT